MPGKINASLNKKLQNVEWGEYKLGDLFEKIEVISLNYKTSELPNVPTGKFILPALTAGIRNQGLNNYVPTTNATILKNVISISANGANTGATFYQNKEFTILQDAYAIKWKYSSKILSDNHYLFLVASITKTIYGSYEWTNKAGWTKVKNEKIQLPVKSNKIDFDLIEIFMRKLKEERIRELEEERIHKLSAYFNVSGLKDYELTSEETKALDSFNKLDWKNFNLEILFGKSTRGKRLKGSDRIAGNLPFVTAGETNEGISAFIGNDVSIFSKNTITIDMFGSAKYRSYDYGGDDHIAVVHTEKLQKFAALFITTAINKSSYTGKFNYSRNFYAKDADELNILLPTTNNTPNFTIMETFISAIQKLVIKEIVLYTDRKIQAAKTVVSTANLY